MLFGFSAVTDSAQDSLDRHFTPANISFKTEMKRLDEAVKLFSSKPNQKILLLIWNQPGKSQSSALRRLRKSKEYLICAHRIAPEKITAKYVGDNSDLGITMKIFVVDENDLSSLK